MLAAAAAGRMPAPDGGVTVLPRAAGGAVAGVVGFTAHHVVAADVDPDWVRSVLPPGSLSAPMSARFLAALADRVGAEPGAYDTVLQSAPCTAPVTACPGWTPGRRSGRLGPVAPGRALPGRRPGLDGGRRDPRRRPRAWPAAGRSRSRSTRRIGAAGSAGPWSRPRPGLVPPGAALWAQVSPANVASLRMFLAAGYRPVCAEVLFA